ncbi:speckle-type POZ protein-like A [Episyrphus balteatus]|uniref:speckle-type POZ protein-like A n=1 Tax=Episyrphus balteatus TaxID=286459 RepID=UPI0024857229|nr:speckle-type POZ protein-like A [Episyrphus balteatus]
MANKEVIENRGITKIAFKWTINNFSFLCTTQHSPKFSGNDDNLIWNLELCPKYRTKDGDDFLPDDYVSLYLKLLQGPVGAEKILCKYKMYILNDIGKILHVKEISDGVEFGKNDRHGFATFIRRRLLKADLKPFLLGDVLRIVCKIEALTNKENISGQNAVGQKKNSESHLIADLDKLLQSQIHSEVKLVVGKFEFPAHKNILATRSDVFKAMFEHNMKETKSGRVIITDVKAEVVKEMLHFIYTGNSPKIKEMANELFIVADKYALNNLKEMSEIALFEKMSIETAAETLILADRYNMELLKKKTLNYITIHGKNITKTIGWNLNYITIHGKNITKTIGWKEMILKHPELVEETLIALLSSTK